MSTQASKLDMDKLAKVRRLMTEGATEGERAAAHARAEAMAKRAGMTLKQAASKVDSKPNGFAYSQEPAGPSFADIFRDIHQKMDDEKEAKEPGYKARKRERQEGKARAQAQRREDLLREHGSKEALFDLTPIEQALYGAAKPHAKRNRGTGYFTNATFYWTSELGGVGDFAFDGRKRSAESLAAIRDAWPFPETIAGLLGEMRMWAQLRSERQLFVDGEYHDHLEVQVRKDILEQELWSRPVESWDDMEARFAWDQFEWERQWIDPEEHQRSDDGKMQRLREDFAILRKLYEAPAQNGHSEGITTIVMPSDATGRPVSPRRTNADKQRDVLSMLRSHPALSNREIARRCGVSPQTVGNWRGNTVPIGNDISAPGQ